jgi:hypothetical protein
MILCHRCQAQLKGSQRRILRERLTSGSIVSGGGEAEPSGPGGVFLVLTPRRAYGPSHFSEEALQFLQRRGEVQRGAGPYFTAPVPQSDASPSA